MLYRLSLAFAALIFATAAVSGKVYRWEDDSGQIHYGEQPPDGAEAEPIKPSVSEPASSSTQSSPSPQQGESGGRTDQASAESQGNSAGEVDEDYVQKQCKKARQAVASLQKNGPDARYANENDEIVTYSKEEFQQQLDEAKRFRERFCADDSNSGSQS